MLKFHTFQESGLSLSFSTHWLVRHYDQHTYFRGLSGVGLKGVDFVGVYRNKELFLMEVKNYLYDNAGLRRTHICRSLSHPGQIAHELAHKMVDTLHAIRLVERYFEKSLLYRMCRPVLPYLKRIAPEWYFWTLAGRLASVQLSYICWLELEHEHRYLAKSIEQQARNLVQDYPVRLEVRSVGENPFGKDLQIRG